MKRWNVKRKAQANSQFTYDQGRYDEQHDNQNRKSFQPLHDTNTVVCDLFRRIDFRRHVTDAVEDKRDNAGTEKRVDSRKRSVVNPSDTKINACKYP